MKQNIKTPYTQTHLHNIHWWDVAENKFSRTGDRNFWLTDDNFLTTLAKMMKKHVFHINVSFCLFPK